MLITKIMKKNIVDGLNCILGANVHPYKKYGYDGYSLRRKLANHRNTWPTTKKWLKIKATRATFRTNDQRSKQGSKIVTSQRSRLLANADEYPHDDTGRKFSARRVPVWNLYSYQCKKTKDLMHLYLSECYLQNTRSWIFWMGDLTPEWRKTNILFLFFLLWELQAKKHFTIVS